MQAGTGLVVILVFAFLAESLTEYFFATWLASKWLRYVSAVVGVLLAVNWGVNLPRDFLGLTGWLPFTGEILTGLLLGRGANWVNDLMKRILGSGDGDNPAGTLKTPQPDC